ncbi:MAG: serine/threonine-protein kinase [Planctomycetota bacterium]
MSSNASSATHAFLEPPKNAAEEIGSLGHYRVIRELGRGGMGFVFLAEDVKLKRQVALKVMNQKIAATPGSRKRFISEARAMAAVHQDNVATIFEVGEHKGTPFMAMELLEGSTLEDFHENHGEPDFNTVIAYAKDIARGLGAAHSKGIVHRDIKPANIWHDTKTDRIKVLDFGLALAQTPVDQLSGRGAVVGTPGYLSPEQARSEPLDDRSDLYSVGVVLYELACGALPLKTKSVADQLIAILAHAPKPLRSRNEKVPQPLADLIHKLMAKEPRDRFQSARELEEALEKAEKECESKTEVAQAINQLQLGLQQAVAKKKSPPKDAFAFDAAKDSMPNPFDSLPGVSAPAALNAAAGKSGVHAAVTIPAPAEAHPYAAQNRNGTQRPKSKKPAPPTNKNLWIGIGIAAAALAALIPAVVYFSTTNAIARQQNENTTIIVDPSAANGGNNSAPSNNDPSRNNSSASKADSGSSRPDSSANRSNIAGNASSLPPLSARPQSRSTTVASLNISKVGAEGAKWVIGTKGGNGSFEQGVSGPSTPKIPGWKMQAFGKQGGWEINRGAQVPEHVTRGFAGPNSKLLLTSDPVWYRAKEGDVICVAATIGGKGNAASNYEFVLGFLNDQGTSVRYQLASFDDRTPWNGTRRKQVMFGYRADKSVAGMKPFLEIVVSNANNGNRKGLIDRVVMTTFSANIADSALGLTASSNQNPTSDFGGNRREQYNNGGSSMASTPNTGRSGTNFPGLGGRSMNNPSGNSTAAGESKPGDAAPNAPALREVKVTTADEDGADATVKRGSSSSNPFGAKPSLVVQTRNGRQIQHAYIRFIIDAKKQSQNGGGFNGGGVPGGRFDRSGNRARQNRIGSAALSLHVIDQEAAVTVRVYGFDDRVSNIWPEDKIVWSNSLSSEGVGSLPLLAEKRIEPGEKNIRIESSELAQFIGDSNNRSVTLILTGQSGTEQITFASKESSQAPPTLTLGINER